MGEEASSRKLNGEGALAPSSVLEMGEGDKKVAAAAARGRAAAEMGTMLVVASS